MQICHCHSPSRAPVNPDWFYLSVRAVTKFALTFDNMRNCELRMFSAHSIFDECFTERCVRFEFIGKSLFLCV